MSNPQSIHDRPIVIPKATIDRLLKFEKCGPAIALYTFYYYTAIWQKTNQPHCTEDYVRGGLGFGIPTIRRAKKQLKELGLISDIDYKRRNKDGKYNKHYIQVCFYEGGEPYVRKLTSGGHTLGNHTLENPPVDKLTTNAYSTNKINAYSTNNKKLSKVQKAHFDQDTFFKDSKDAQKKTPQHNLSILLYKAIPNKYKRTANRFPKKDDTTGKRNFTYWAREFKKLLTQYKYKQIKTTLLWYKEHIEEKYIPKRLSAKRFCEDYEQILEAMDKQREQKRYDNMSSADRYEAKRKKQQAKDDMRDYVDPKEYFKKHGKYPF